MSLVAWFLVGWLILAAITAGWLWWEMRNAPQGFETEHGYGPVSERHAAPLEEPVLFDWPARPVEDESQVRHGGLGR